MTVPQDSSKLYYCICMSFCVVLLQVLAHLAVVPDYLVPPSLRAAAAAAGGGTSSSAKKRTRESPVGSSDPLKTFAYNATKLGGAVGSAKVCGIRSSMQALRTSRWLLHIVVCLLPSSCLILNIILVCVLFLQVFV